MLGNVDVLLTALVLTAVTVKWLPAGVSSRLRLRAGIAVLVLSILPYPWGLAVWVLSYLSGFSISAGVLALIFLRHYLSSKPPLPASQVRQASVLLVVVALVFYPLSMGVSEFDPYALGYGSAQLSCLLLGVGVAALIARNMLLCVLLIVAQLAWATHLLRSDNLWDYLFDPWLVGWAVAWLVADCRVRRQAPQQHSLPVSASAPTELP